MHVTVLCGGEGTRLGEPIKCLTEVAGRPFMDWKVEQLQRCGATEITLVVGPFLQDFYRRYGNMVRYVADLQTGVRDALRVADARGWWTMGDVLLEQHLEPYVHQVHYVVPGEQIGGLWLDCGLYHGRGPWEPIQTAATPWTINTPEERRATHENLLRLSLAR